MAAPQQQRATQAPVKALEEPKDFCVGLRKVGPSLYRVVELTAQGEKVVAREMDFLDQDLEHSARTIMLCLKKLVGRID